MKQEACSFHCTPDCMQPVQAYQSLPLNPMSGHTCAHCHAETLPQFWSFSQQSLLGSHHSMAILAFAWRRELVFAAATV